MTYEIRLSLKCSQRPSNGWNDPDRFHFGSGAGEDSLVFFVWLKAATLLGCRFCSPVRPTLTRLCQSQNHGILPDMFLSKAQ